MEYTGIIQLIIATIFYSTLVAPSIKKMSELRSDISDKQFPLKTDTEYKAESVELGIAINKKIKQYAAIYGETRKFLWFLYGALAIAFLSQLIPFIYIWIISNSMQWDTAVNALITLIIFVLLILAMSIFILKPEQIRTFGWLSSVGIAQVHAYDIFNPFLELNRVGKNVKESNNHVNIGLVSDIALYGYNILLTIEDTSGEKIYHVVAGRVQKEKYIKAGSNQYPDGKNQAIIELVHSLHMKPGMYKVRLLIFDTIFRGNRSPVEVTAGLNVTERTAQTSIIEINMHVQSNNYSYKCENNAPYSIEFNDDFAEGNAIRGLLSVDRFQKLFSSTKMLYDFSDINGMITSEYIRRIHSPANVFVRTWWLRLRKRRTSRKRRTTIIRLS